MADASLDENSVPSLIATLNTTGSSIVRILADPTAHTIKVVDDTTGTDHGPVNALRDSNDRPVIMAVSSADGVTPVAVYADASGNLLIDSN